MQSHALEGERRSRAKQRGIFLMLDQPAPDFTLNDQHGACVTLSDFRGRSGVVLIFYVMDDTPG